MLRVIEPIENPSMHVFDNALELNGVALLTKIRTAFIPGMSGEKGSIDGEDLIGKESQKVGHFHQDMKDIIVKLFSQSLLEIGKGSFTGDVGIADTGIQSKMFPPIPVLENFQEGFHVGVFFKGTEELGEKKAHRVIGKAEARVTVSDNGADEREIHQGGDEPGQTAHDRPVRMNFNVSTLVPILGQPECLGFWKRVVVFGVDSEMDAVEFFDDIPQVKGRDISRSPGFIRMEVMYPLHVNPVRQRYWVQFV
jgi:hypothetical protein